MMAVWERNRESMLGNNRKSTIPAMREPGQSATESGAILPKQWLGEATASTQFTSQSNHPPVCTPRAIPDIS